MITSENIQQYINFLHLKKYLMPASAVLLGKWGALSDTEIRNNLDGLYQHWAFDPQVAKDYETEFLASQKQTEIIPPTNPEATPTLTPTPKPPPSAVPPDLQREVSPATGFDAQKKDRSGSSFKFIVIACILLLAIGAGAWYFTGKNAADKEKKALEQKAALADRRTNEEQRIQEEKEKALQQQALEKAAKINDFKTNRDHYIKQAVSYSYDGFWGGIKNVVLKVTNNSDFKMNEVTVMLSYIKKNGDFFESKKVTVFNIPPHDSKVIAGPTSKRGVKVDSKIISVKSDAIDSTGT